MSQSSGLVVGTRQPVVASLQFYNKPNFIVTSALTFSTRGVGDMCIVFVSFQHHEGFKLVVLVNRDEYMDRPTATAGWWPGEQLLGAKDLLREGAQFAVDKKGRFGVLTNFRCTNETLY